MNRINFFLLLNDCCVKEIAPWLLICLEMFIDMSVGSKHGQLNATVVFHCHKSVLLRRTQLFNTREELAPKPLPQRDKIALLVSNFGI